MSFNETIEWIGKIVEAVGVVVIIIGAMLATVQFVGTWRGKRQTDGSHSAYRDYRRSLGRSILLGLEFLVAGDIIRTVIIEPSFESAGVLAIIIAIRTFLSIELELEIDGRWPWQRDE